jgi:hypothetical protein
VLLQRGHVLGQVAAGQQAAVHLGVQGLDAAVQHLGKPVCSATSVTGRPASASSLAVPPVDSSLRRGRAGLGEFDDAGLVGDREECGELVIG